MTAGVTIRKKRNGISRIVRKLTAGVAVRMRRCSGTRN
jgi:hypothetical protein